jgi:hypothetical protein
MLCSFDPFFRGSKEAKYRKFSAKLKIKNFSGLGGLTYVVNKGLWCVFLVFKDFKLSAGFHDVSDSPYKTRFLKYSIKKM